MEQTKTMDGRVIAVRGAVVDVAFDGGVTLPPIGREVVEAGGLMSYATDRADMFRQVGFQAST